MRIICCGNPDRGDDGAGMLVAARLRELVVEVESRTGEALELVESWSGGDDVVLVDAVVTGAPAGTVQMLDAGQVAFPDARPVSTHGLGLADVIAIARTLGRLPNRVRMYAIEGRQFQVGTEVSPEVRRAVETVARRIAAEAVSTTTKPVHDP
jgi:hydrogenase maturation protease